MTTLTKGWKGPGGLCDMCNRKPATHWFGDTSVALCNDEYCADRNMAKWRRMIEEMEEEDDRNHWLVNLHK